MKIRVMADYHCAPLWHDGQEHVGEIKPEALGLTDGLCADLWAWARAYDATLVLDDPIKSGFSSDAYEQAFEEQGRLLASRVAGELGASAQVRFQSGRLLPG